MLFSIKSRIALAFRRLQGRYGIAAPQVTVQTYIPWYFRVIAVSVLVTLFLVMTVWAYDIGSRMAGFEQGEASDAVSKLRETNGSLEEELARLRSMLVASESNLQIEKAAQQQINEKYGILLSENARLKEELAVYERLSPKNSDAARPDSEVEIDKPVIQSLGGSRYRYGFILSLASSRRSKERRFNLQLILSLQSGGKIALPREGDSDRQQYEIVTRNFKRVEGVFTLPENVNLEAAEFRISESGVLKASRNIPTN